MVLIAASWSVITYGCMSLTTTLDEKWTKFVLVSLTNMGGTTVQYDSKLSQTCIPRP